MVDIDLGSIDIVSAAGAVLTGSDSLEDVLAFLKTSMVVMYRESEL